MTMPQEPTYEELAQRIRQLEDLVLHRKQPAGHIETAEETDILESLDAVSQALHKSKDVAHIVDDVIGVVFSIFDCDRIWLFYPCDPDAPTFKVLAEKNKPEYPGAFATGQELPITPEAAETIKKALNSGSPAVFDPESGNKIDDIAARFSVLSQMIMAVHPKTGKPWMFGMHQCAYARVWTRKEQLLFKEISIRVVEGLNNLILLESLRKSEAKYRHLLDNLPQKIFYKDINSVYVSCNEKYANDLNITPDEIVGTNDFDYHPKELAEKYIRDDKRIIQSKEVEDIVDKYRVDERECWVHTVKTPLTDDNGQVTGILGIFRDITDLKRMEDEKKKLEAQLLQAQRIESMGRLAGGVAHDFNNMLSIILGCAEMILEDIDANSPYAANLNEIQRAALRSTELVKQLLAFARKQTIAPQVLDLNRTLKSLLSMLRRLMGEDIDLAWRPEENLWPVKIDPSQVDQILTNLCVNARYAIKGIGKVTIETGNVLFNGDYCDQHPGCMPGKFVMLAVSDNGLGMDKKTMDKIFEPFFTTREIGQGTGLGLATVYGIVKQNSGFINVYSEPNKGTTFRIYFPCYPEETIPAATTDSGAEISMGDETILLVEDEKAILKVTAIMLQRLGYNVIAAQSPGEAVRIAQASQSEIHLLMTDVVMPEMSGRELAAMLLHSCPKIKCLFMSGYTANVIAHHGVLEEGIKFINKPFSKQELAAKVREVLSEANGTSPI